MNLLSTEWFSEPEIEENNIIQQYHMNTFSSIDTINGFNSDLSYDDLIEEKPSKILKTSYILPKLQSPLSSPPPLFTNSKPPHVHHNHHHHHHHDHQTSSRILSFEKAGPNVIDQHHDYSPAYLNSILIPKEEIELPRKSGFNRVGTKRTQPFTRNQSNHAQEHILAERKRREKLTQRFVALSSLLPGLKKMDKASVLGDAVKHIKNLEEKVKEFEEQKRERRMESMVLVKRSKLILDDSNNNQESYSSSSSSVEDDFSGLNLPEIEVRFADKDVLIKILCEKQKGHVVKIMNEIEKLHFSITNSNVLPFGSTLDITIVAQKESDFNMTLMDVVKSLRSTLSNFM